MNGFRYQLNKGLSLIEMIIVVAIIGSLSAIAIPSYGNYIITTERKRAQLDLFQLQVFVEQAYTANDVYPDAINTTDFDLSKEYVYAIDKSGNGRDAYVLSATPKSASRQVNDVCYAFLINAASDQSNKDKAGGAINKTDCWL